ncbi:heavy metal-associated isoprenylated plant protein 43-like [Quercus lobata]|uniref:HMA domain-containing protein n=1 Tax=Quercus lobata TaxID=97700 RepID=A0A7N2LXM8_QUELO|nr:heavy metal-associated isoprenylated plant protein 43-like [Quercus lobata]
MVQRTVLKVDIACQKCKKKLLKAVSSLQGVDKVEVDEGKGTLTVTGSADPYEIIVRARKTGKFAQVVSIGPPPAPPKKDEKKPDEKKPDEKKPDEKKPDPQPQVFYVPHHCVCERVGVVHIDQWQEPNPSCTIQ